MSPHRGGRGGPSHERTKGHIPVLLSEVLSGIEPKDGETYIDATFGAGGYTRALLTSADCCVVAIERDPASFAAGHALQQEFAPRLTLANETFGRMEHAATTAGLACVNGVVLDIGVSSMQLDDASRGFSFQADGPLDMRMSQSGPTAADVVNRAEEFDLANIIFRYGEERRSRAVARAIVKARGQAPIATTRALAEIIERTLGRPRGDEKHPATRTFQALRIHVNDELGELERGLAAAERLLAPDGRLAVVCFHSLEDRIVKQFLVERAGKAPSASRHLPQSVKFSRPSFRIVNSRPLTPQKGELEVNPRARSARLRLAVRTEAPPWAD